MIMFQAVHTGLVLAILMPALISADCMCVGTGDPHYLMCDGKTFYDWQGSGLHQVFKTESVEVQCLNEKRGTVSVIDHCRIRVRQNGCDLVVQAPSSNSTQMIINGDLVTDPTLYSIDPRFQTKINKKPDMVQMEIEADGGQITMDFSPFSFGILAKGINRCSGMCGDCSGPQKRPTNITRFVEPFTAMDPIISGNQCTNQNTTLKSTNSTSVMKPLAPVAPAQVPDDRVVPGHPVFESEAVMKQVYQQCLAGQDSSRMNDDAIFAAFVESCIYDKSLGPGAEQAAHSTMRSFVTAANRSRQLSLPDWQNVTMRATVLKLDDILSQTVTKRPEEIRPNSGVTYELKHIYVEQSRPKADYLMPRTARWSSQTLQVGIPYESAFSSMASVENSQNTSGMIAQKLRLHFDIEAPVVVIQPPAPNVKLEAKATPIARAADESSETPRRRRIPIDEEPESRPRRSSPKAAQAVANPGVQTQPTPAAITTPAPTTTMLTAAPTPAPTTVTRPPVKQFQIATIVRQREVPASEIKEAPPAPEIPLQLLQQVAQPAVQTVVVARTPAPSPVAMMPAAPVMPVAAVPVQPIAAMPVQPVAAMPAQPVAMAAMPAQQIAAMPAQPMMAAPSVQGQVRERRPQQQVQQQQQQQPVGNQQRAGILIPQQQMMVQHPVTVSGTPMMVSQGGNMGMFGGMGQFGQPSGGQMMAGNGRDASALMRPAVGATGQAQGAQGQFGMGSQGLGDQAQKLGTAGINGQAQAGTAGINGQAQAGAGNLQANGGGQIGIGARRHGDQAQRLGATGANGMPQGAGGNPMGSQQQLPSGAESQQSPDSDDSSSGPNAGSLGSSGIPGANGQRQGLGMNETLPDSQSVLPDSGPTYSN